MLKRTIAILVVFAFSTHSFAKEELSSTQIKQYKSGIFEVVTLKLEDKTEYATPFPHHLIPFQSRNDKYHSVGTAFLIDDKTFVSAAHVFGIGLKSQLADNYALRDEKGKVLTISQVTKFSNYRDLIQFSVEQETKDYHKFSLASVKNEAGDTVYAAGNALGEGVIFRKGTLTSFTFEPIDGKWKNIRYSAAASPGNSGGPLLNLNGEVIGIVTQKSDNENLNYAFPIQNFIKFTADTAEFFEPQLGEVESTQRLMFSWEFSTALPKDILTLRKEAEASYLNRFRLGRKEFERQFKSELFPNHKNVAKYLKNQSDDESLAIIDVNGNGKWSLFVAENEDHVSIDNNQSMWFSSSNKMLGNYQFFMQKPESMSLKDFVDDKKTILDTFLTSVKWNRRIKDTPVYIKSYGEPAFEETHKDKYGRIWDLAIWYDAYADRGMMIYCLPMPQGVVCDLLSTATAMIEVYKVGYRDNLHRIMLSYGGQLDEWQAFLALPKSKVPAFLTDAKLSLNNDGVDFKVGKFAGKFDGLALSANSSLYVGVEISPDNLNKLTVGYFVFRPNIYEDASYSLTHYYNMQGDASESYADFWRKFSAQAHPYNFSLIDEGNVFSKQLNLSSNHRTASQFGYDPSNIGYLAVCNMESTKGEARLNESCDNFINGLSIHKPQD